MFGECFSLFKQYAVMHCMFVSLLYLLHSDLLIFLSD